MFKKLPICIIGSAPRCGSTLFALNLRDQSGIKCFLEPWNEKALSLSALLRPKGLDKRQQQELKEYLEYKKDNQTYIVKFFLNDIEHRSPYLKDIKIGYKIGIARKNIIDQVASWYIADYRNKYSTLKDEIEDDYSITINHVNISIYINEVSRRNFLFENCNIFDEKIYYEDIDVPKSSNHLLSKTKQPTNLDELKFIIAKQLNDLIPKHWILN